MSWWLIIYRKLAIIRSSFVWDRTPDFVRASKSVIRSLACLPSSLLKLIKVSHYICCKSSEELRPHVESWTMAWIMLPNDWEGDSGIASVTSHWHVQIDLKQFVWFSFQLKHKSQVKVLTDTELEIYHHWQITIIHIDKSNQLTHITLVRPVREPWLFSWFIV